MRERHAIQLVQVSLLGVPVKLLRGRGWNQFFSLCFVTTVYCLGCIGTGRGQPFSSTRRRIVEGNIVHLPVGYQEPHTNHKDKNILALDGIKSPHGD